MPTAISSTERVTGLRRDLTDLRSLIAFRLASVRGRSRRRLGYAFVLLLAITAVAVVVPAHSAGAGTDAARDPWLQLLPYGVTGFFLMAAAASIGSGGGRELVAHDRAVAFPISPATDHFGALLMAPLNIAWLVQAWSLLGLTSYVGGPGSLVSGPPVLLAWICLATALGQLVGWGMEVVRRGPNGVLHARLVLGTIGLASLGLAGGGLMDDVFAAVPTGWIGDAALGEGLAWWLATPALLALAVVAVLVGIPVARTALRRPARDEQKLESSHYRARHVVTGPDDRLGDLLLLLRIDRGAIVRSVPLRRGLVFLALTPGLGALAVPMDWSVVVLLVGLISSAVALLFGVNGWSLDGRGALWRETLPVPPGLVFVSRSLLLAEVTVSAVLVAVVLAAVRAERPTAAVVAALLCALVVITLQVVATCARWSIRNPHVMDLRSARAVPAPPAVMLGYSARLALGTTLTAMIFSGLSAVTNPWLAPIVSVPFLVWSSVRLWKASRAWRRPLDRSVVITTVAA